MYETLLDCGHVKQYALKRAVPQVGKEVVCTRHDEPRAATVLHWQGGWKLKCRDCGFGRQLGTDKGYAIKIARTIHLSKYPTHAIELFIEGRQKEETIQFVKPLPTVEQGTFSF